MNNREQCAHWDSLADFIYCKRPRLPLPSASLSQQLRLLLHLLEALHAPHRLHAAVKHLLGLREPARASEWSHHIGDDGAPERA